MGLFIRPFVSLKCNISFLSCSQIISAPCLPLGVVRSMKLPHALIYLCYQHENKLIDHRTWATSPSPLSWCIHDMQPSGSCTYIHKHIEKMPEFMLDSPARSTLLDWYLFYFLSISLAATNLNGPAGHFITFVFHRCCHQFIHKFMVLTRCENIKGHSGIILLVLTFKSVVIIHLTDFGISRLCQGYCYHLKIISPGSRALARESFIT